MLKWNSARLYKKFSIGVPCIYCLSSPTSPKDENTFLFSFFSFLFDTSLSCSFSFFPSSLSSLISCRSGLLNFFLPHAGFQVLRGFWSMKDFMGGGNLLIQGAYIKIMLILMIVYPQLWRDEYLVCNLTSMLQKITSLLWSNVDPPKRVRKRKRYNRKQSSEKKWKFWEE